MTYIALLRAINIGGHTVKMDQLRSLFAELGFTNVRSFIQTGNVFFESEEKDRAVLTARIESHLADKLGYAVPALLRTVEELEASLIPNPFTGVTVTDDIRLYVAYLSHPVPEDLPIPFESPMGDFKIIKATPREAFVILKLINGRPSNFGATLEKKYGFHATSRFYHTSLKILEAAKKKN
jgi:uncharacterized protein (DUF1697 family)